MKIARIWTPRYLHLALIVLCLGLTGGCGESEPSNTVTGKVTVNGAPVMGTIHFSAGGKEVTGSVGMNGEYYVANPPLGEATITLKPHPSAATSTATMAPPPNAAGPAMPGMPSAAKMAGPPPAKYSDPANGLKYTVIAGKQVHNIELTP